MGCILCISDINYFIFWIEIWCMKPDSHITVVVIFVFVDKWTAVKEFLIKISKIQIAVYLTHAKAFCKWGNIIHAVYIAHASNVVLSSFMSLYLCCDAVGEGPARLWKSLPCSLHKLLFWEWEPSLSWNNVSNKLSKTESSSSRRRRLRSNPSCQSSRNYCHHSQCSNHSCSSSFYSRVRDSSHSYRHCSNNSRHHCHVSSK